MKPEPDSPPPITEPEAFLRFIQSYPDLRRWYVARVFGDDRPIADLYSAKPTEVGRAVFAENDVADIDEDLTKWWEDEDFDLAVHLPVDELAELLADETPLPASALVEGAVFIQVMDDISPKSGGRDLARVRFVPFSHQARAASQRLYRRLLKQDEENEDRSKPAL